MDCNSFINDGRYQLQGENILNAPPWISSTYGHFFIDVFHHMDNWVRQIAYEVNSTRICTRACLAGSWSQWEPIATAIKPQEFSLPLAEGVTTVGAGYKNIYSKDQFGIVRVWFSVHFESIPASGTHVFNLPEGFRPDSICCAAAVLSMVEYYNATVAIHPSGDALVDHGTIGQTGPINLHGYIEFPAAS